ncbi:methyltransferase domain-containing protein [Sorangium sp. So ce1097]|uniref:methyltransferase domain-containing protein n=1 Tax=Sorangium sp. So ce1097 TaxID=3133330 RepID=UPI003F6165B5
MRATDGAGMRVLDVGRGRGDVSRMIAQLVGGQGQVVGVDRDGRPLAAARGRVDPSPPGEPDGAGA